MEHPYGFNSSTTNFTASNYKELSVKSTNVNRAIASAYAELLGFTNDGEIHEGLKLKQAQADNIASEAI